MRSADSAKERISSGSSEGCVNAIDFFDSEEELEPCAVVRSELDMAALHAALRLLQAGVPTAPYRSAPEPSTEESRLRKLAIRAGFGDELLLRRYEDSPCTTLVVSFCSLTEASAGVQHEWVGTTKRAGVAHALFLTDPLQAWYLRSSASDPFAATLAAVTTEIHALLPSHIVCIGSSMGGYAAARCALALGALFFAGLTSVTALAFGPQGWRPAIQLGHTLAVLCSRVRVRTSA
jgi:hypothetical protein